MPLQSTTIYSRVFTTSPGTALVLRGNEFTQPISIRERWTKIRIGLFAAISTNTTNNIYDGSLTVGLCSNGRPFTSNTANFIGFFFGGNSAGSTWTYTANSGNPYYVTTQFYYGTKINTTYNVATVGSLNSILPTSEGSALARRAILYCDIAKAGGIWTPQGTCTAAAHMAFDMNVGHFFNVMEQCGGTPTILGTSLQGPPGAAVNFSETAAEPVSTVNIHWNKWRFPLEIYALAVYQIQ